MNCRLHAKPEWRVNKGRTCCRAAGRAVEVHVFEEDTHSLGRPATSLYQWVRVLPFLDMHLLCER